MNQNTTLDITEISQHIYTVSQLNREVRDLLFTAYPHVWIEGEISNLARPTSGHIYFSLKDSAAQVRCAMFRTNQQRLPFKVENGMQVIIAGSVGLYEGRGEYQIIVEQIEPAGDGKLRLAFEQLKNKLSTEGLFDAKNKKAIPKLPLHIGVVTSATGAAIRDILTVLKRRSPNIPVMIYPTLVQGATAANQIAEAIKLANNHNQCDILILARGGGSLEDLWAFNEEVVARAIYASNIPIISAIGHEIDFTIADFVADQRAATPSAAAELVSPKAEDLQQILQDVTTRITRLMETYLRHENILLNQLMKRLKHPGERIREQRQTIDYLEQRLCMQMNFHIKHAAQKLTHIAATLNSISPLAVLQRGYAIVTRADNSVVRDAKKLMLGEEIQIRLANGSVKSIVEKIEIN